MPIDDRNTAKSLGFPTVLHKASGRLAKLHFLDEPVRADIEWLDGATADGEITATVLPSDLDYAPEHGSESYGEMQARIERERIVRPTPEEELELSPVQTQLAGAGTPQPSEPEAPIPPAADPTPLPGVDPEPPAPAPEPEPVPAPVADPTPAEDAQTIGAASL